VPAEVEEWYVTRPGVQRESGLVVKDWRPKDTQWAAYFMVNQIGTLSRALSECFYRQVSTA
jgi:hypothetical protein